MRKILMFLIGVFISCNIYSDKIPKQWKKSFYKKGKQKVYNGEELKTIGMPCGGIAAGQLYVRGDGTLACWWIANNAYNTGDGLDKYMTYQTKLGEWKSCYQTYEPYSYIEQYFSLNINGKSYKLTKEDFNDISFIGEYPIAKVNYNDKSRKLPVSVTMEVFSPFIPLDAKNSALPTTILKFKIKNRTRKTQNISLDGVLQNPVMLETPEGKFVNENKNNGLYMSFSPDSEKLKNHAYFGNIYLKCLNEASVVTDIKSNREGVVKSDKKLVGKVFSAVTLESKEEKEITYVLSWYFPNRPQKTGGGYNWAKPIPTEGKKIKNMYGNWFSGSIDVANYVSKNIRTLSRQTYKFHESYYKNSTLPYWLNQRIMMPTSILATETTQWWANDKFYMWEGVGSCEGTCTHVYNYEHALSRLFPSLERNIRNKTDFTASYGEDGSVATRNGHNGVKIDGHIGTVLKAYREHLISDNNSFLKSNWSKIKNIMLYAIKRDGNDNGLIEGTQNNTYDIGFHGANTYVGGLYIAALKACARMAELMRDNDFAQKCNTIADRGTKNSVQKLWNGEYFIQDVDLKKYTKFQYAQGCLSDHVFGQTWAHQLNLGYIYPKDKIRKSLESIWKYNWKADVGTYNQEHKPSRTYADPGEPGLLNCTWPKSEYLPNGVRYKNEVWTGIEYQVATNMINEGMVEEGLALVKGVHERYRPEKHNPWNEIECGDHYGRAMASWGILLALQGYHYDGPKGLLQFKPIYQKTNTRSFFTTSGMWGNFVQKIKGKSQINTIEVGYGKERLKSISIACKQPKKVEYKLNGETINTKWSYKNGFVRIDIDFELKEGDVLKIKIR